MRLCVCVRWNSLFCFDSKLESGYHVHNCTCRELYATAPIGAAWHIAHRTACHYGMHSKNHLHFINRIARPLTHSRTHAHTSLEVFYWSFWCNFRIRNIFLHDFLFLFFFSRVALQWRSIVYACSTLNYMYDMRMGKCVCASRVVLLIPAIITNWTYIFSFFAAFRSKIFASFFFFCRCRCLNWLLLVLLRRTFGLFFFHVRLHTFIFEPEKMSHNESCVRLPTKCPLESKTCDENLWHLFLEIANIKILGSSDEAVSSKTQISCSQTVCVVACLPCFVFFLSLCYTYLSEYLRSNCSSRSTVWYKIVFFLVSLSSGCFTCHFFFAVAVSSHDKYCTYQNMQKCFRFINAMQSNERCTCALQLIA